MRPDTVLHTGTVYSLLVVIGVQRARVTRADVDVKLVHGHSTAGGGSAIAFVMAAAVCMASIFMLEVNWKSGIIAAAP